MDMTGGSFRKRPGESEFAFVFRRLSALGAPFRFVLLVLVGIIALARCALVRCARRPGSRRVVLLPPPDPIEPGQM